MRRVVATAVASMLGALLACAVAPAAFAQSTGPLDFEARIDGQEVGNGNLVIDPTREASIEITVRNETDSLQRVKTVRLSGTALALTFFAYDTTVAFDVPAGATVERSFPLDLADLDRQATGLLPATVQLLSPEREVIAELSTTSDVRGSVWSVFGVFGIAVVAMTLLAWAGALIALARGKLPANRWRRALRFLPAGFGTGLSAVITLSVLRLVAPAPAAEIPMVLGAAAAAFLLGYLTPHPNPAVPDAGDPADASTEYQHEQLVHGQYVPQGPTGQVGTDYLVTGRGVPTYPAGQLPPGLMPPHEAHQHGAHQPDGGEQVTEAHRVPTAQQYPQQPYQQPAPPPFTQPPYGTSTPPTPAHGMPALAHPAPGQPAQVRPEVVQPKKQSWPAVDKDATVDADATVQAGLLSDFLERPDGRR